MVMPTLKELAEAHSWNIDHRPVYARWSIAAFAVGVGCAFGAARGLVNAALNPPGQRLAAFILTARGVTPLYVIPFVLGTQYDCYLTEQSRKGRPIRSHASYSTGAAELG